MGRPEEIAALIKSGQLPLAIARSIVISHTSVIQYLYTAVGRELLSRSEILFAIEGPYSSFVETLAARNDIRTLEDLRRMLRSVGGQLSKQASEVFRSAEEEMLLYFHLREAPLADMYESLCRLETYLHAYIRTQLEHGLGPQGWWRKGIPEAVRRDCADAKERDSEPQDDPYCYTTFIHLRDIFDRQWGIFCHFLPRSVAGDKPKFLADLVQLNGVRNRIMHPVRGYRPTKQDFDFVKDFASRMFAEDATPSA